VHTDRYSWLLAALLLAAAAQAPSAAAEVEAGRQVQLASGLEVLALAEAAGRRGDTATAERALRALFADPSPELRAEARFRLAKLLVERGQVLDAAVLLRQIVDEHPNAARARLELAGVLQKLGEEESALRQLRALSAMSLPTPLANFVDRVAASLHAAKPFGLYAELALAPDSNINRATRSDTLGTVIGDFTVDEDSKARSGVGAALRSAAHARHRFSDRASIVARATADTNIYEREEFNYLYGEAAAGLEFDLGNRRATLSAGHGRSWFGMKPASNHWRVSSGITQRVGAVSQLRLDAGLRWTDNVTNRLQDGRGSSARLGYERAISPRLFITGFAGVDRLKARDDGYSTRSTALGVTAHRDLGRITISAGSDFAWLKADERLILFPKRRKDKFSRFHLSGVFRDLTIGGFAPMARFSFERTRSTIELHDYTRTRTELGITRSF
jgi:tetratricopeptide (TPR) repeat protein